MSNVAGGARTPLLVAAVTLAIGVFACSGASPEHKPVDSSPATSAETTPALTPSPSETPTPTPNTTATDLEQQLEDATVAFYAAVSDGYKQMDPAPINAAVLPGSSAGGGYVSDIAGLKGKRQHYMPAPTFSISNFKAELGAATAPSSAVVTFTLTGHAANIVDEKGKPVQKLPGGSTNARVIFVKKGAKWLVRQQKLE